MRCIVHYYRCYEFKHIITYLIQLIIVKINKLQLNIGTHIQNENAVQ